jgi:DNA-binding IclR family transcriptional regulator
MTNTKTDYTNSAQQRLIKVILALFGDVVHGLSPGAIAKSVGCSSPMVTRDLDNLASAGIAQRDEATGLWRLTPRLPQQAIKVWTAIDRAEQRLAESRQRFSRNPD